MGLSDESDHQTDSPMNGGKTDRRTTQDTPPMSKWYDQPGAISRTKWRHISIKTVSIHTKFLELGKNHVDATP